jgi:ASC-1-like (ASCH) protein
MGFFPLGSPDQGAKGERYTEHERELLDKVAQKVVHWKMTVPAIMTLESVKPLNYIGSQAMVFFEPMVQTLLNLKDYDTFRQMLEKRETMEELLLRIERFDAIAHRKEKLFNKLKREFLKRQTFGYRFKSAIIGFRVPQHLESEWKAKLEALDPDGAKKPDTKKES